MALKKYWHGSVGPLLYEDADFHAFQTEGQVLIETSPVNANEAVRIDDLSVIPGGATTVTDETTWDITPAVGTSVAWAHEDHTHGSPPFPLTAQSPIAAPTGGSVIDVEARNAIGSILSALRSNGIIST
jgi:hypothetical protein